MNLIKLRDKYIAEKYDFPNASSRACQEVILTKIAKSPMSKKLTIKGGVVIQSISDDTRRATMDFDLDFINFPLDDEGIRNFIDMLDKVDDGISVRITGTIEDLGHQEYRGKRIWAKLTDSENNSIGIKLDIGVHSNLNLEQEEYCFELDSIGENVQLLINSKEQMFTEKLKSLLKLGRFSTRYKDLFDFYFFINMTNLSKAKLIDCFAEMIYNPRDMKENNIDDINKRLGSILRNRNFIKNANTVHSNWLELPIDKVIEGVLSYFATL